MSSISSQISFPKFADNKVSTKTLIVVSNLKFDINEIFSNFPVAEYVVVPKRRGRKKASDYIDPNAAVENGSIITLKIEDRVRGVDLNIKNLKRKNANNKRGRYFRNSITIVMLIDGKKINFKASRGGKLQVTGCKNNKNIEDGLRYFWKFLKENCKYTFSHGNDIDIVIIPAMRNIDFDLGFLVDRDKLSNYINLNTDHISMLESSFGYTGINVKCLLKKNIRDMKLVSLQNGGSGEDGEMKWRKSHVLYGQYLDKLPEKERERIQNKKRYSTFLCFHSGKVIHSSISRQFMEEPYDDFIDIIRKCYFQIQEKPPVAAPVVSA